MEAGSEKRNLTLLSELDERLDKLIDDAYRIESEYRNCGIDVSIDISKTIIEKENKLNSTIW